MENYMGIKKILLFVVMICTMLCLKDFVNAEERNDTLLVNVVSDGKEYCDTGSVHTLVALGTVKLDLENGILTLDNFKGERILLSPNLEWPASRKLTIRLIGENHIERRLGDKVNQSLLEIDAYGMEKNLDVEFTGTGTLDFNSRNQAQKVVATSCCNVTINGPTLNFVNCNSGGAYGLSNYPVQTDVFVMKSGRVNMDIWPEFRSYDEGGGFYSYGYAIKAGNRIDISGGMLNVSYKFPRDEYKGETILYKDAVVLGCWKEEPKTDNIQLSVDDEIKGKIKLKYEHNISVKCVKESESYRGVVYDDVNLVPGITWDESTKTLTFDGYNEGQVLIESEKYLEKVKVVIKNQNKMKYACYYMVADVVSDGFNTKNIDLEFVGNGSIEIEGSMSMKSDELDRTLVIDGPKIIVNDIWTVENFVMKSGKLIVDVHGSCNNMGMIVEKSFNVFGGTIIGRMDDEFYNGDGRSLFIELGSGCTGMVENCVIICTGYVDRLKENDLAICTYSMVVEGGYCKPINVTMNNVLTYYVRELSNVPAINIGRFKVSIPEKEYVYTGKRIEPKVKVGGLIEGEDYAVTYINNKKIGKANIIVSGVGLYKGNIKISFDIVKKKTGSGKGKSTDKSDAIKYKKLLYRVVSEAEANSKYGKVELVGSVNKKCKKITIPKVVKINNKKYRVVSIAKKAFADCKKLKKVIIKSTSIKKIGRKAFAGKKKITIKVPKKKKKAYKKLLKKAKINKFKIK